MKFLVANVELVRVTCLGCGFSLLQLDTDTLRLVTAHGAHSIGPKEDAVKQSQQLALSRKNKYDRYCSRRHKLDVDNSLDMSYMRLQPSVTAL
jgi:hypothetical protein